MTIANWLFGAMQKLGAAGVDSPRRDALVLLEDTLEKDRSWVLAHAESMLDTTTLTRLEALIERRIKREPLAYIRRKAWFYGRFFEVAPTVMIPRPESESFIELLLQFHPATVIDVGTGSGCLAITAKLELPEAETIAIDMSTQALKIAASNAESHEANINYVQGDLLAPLPNLNLKTPVAVLANLPYVPDDMITSPEIRQEPPEALFSGADGLDHYRKFWQQAAKLRSKPEFILTESLESQHKALEQLAAKTGYELYKTDVLVQLFKRDG